MSCLHVIRSSREVRHILTDLLVKVSRTGPYYLFSKDGPIGTVLLVKTNQNGAALHPSPKGLGFSSEDVPEWDGFTRKVWHILTDFLVKAGQNGTALHINRIGGLKRFIPFYP